MWNQKKKKKILHFQQHNRDVSEWQKKNFALKLIIDACDIHTQRKDDDDDDGNNELLRFPRTNTHTHTKNNQASSFIHFTLSHQIQ